MTPDADSSPESTRLGADWPRRIADRRGRKVIFLSHCLLNENTRYPGGACAAGAATCVLEECTRRGLGIVQMPCPEQRAWGGVNKRHLLRFFGSRDTLAFRARRLLLPLLLAYTRLVYRRLARRVARDVQDCVAAGLTVVGVVGVDGSPSCGVARTLSPDRALSALGALGPGSTATDVNEAVIASLIPGCGLFVEALQAEFARRQLVVPWQAFDLPAELRGGACAPDLGDA